MSLPHQSAGMDGGGVEPWRQRAQDDSDPGHGYQRRTGPGPLEWAIRVLLGSPRAFGTLLVGFGPLLVSAALGWPAVFRTVAIFAAIPAVGVIVAVGRAELEGNMSRHEPVAIGLMGLPWILIILVVLTIGLSLVVFLCRFLFMTFGAPLGIPISLLAFWAPLAIAIALLGQFALAIPAVIFEGHKPDAALGTSYRLAKRNRVRTVFVTSPLFLAWLVGFLLAPATGTLVNAVAVGTISLLVGIFLLATAHLWVRVAPQRIETEESDTEDSTAGGKLRD